MGYRAWTMDLEGETHRVEVGHGFWSGKRSIRVNGELVHESRRFWDTGSEHRFEVGDHACVLKIRNSPFHYDYELFVDGKLV